MVSTTVKKLIEADEIGADIDITRFAQPGALFDTALRELTMRLEKQALQTKESLNRDGSDFMALVQGAGNKKVSDHDVALALLKLTLEKNASPNSDLAYNRIKRYFRYQL